MILRNLSPASPGCMNDLRSIFEALKNGECALGPLKSLVDHNLSADYLSHVGGIAGKLALNVDNEGILTVRRSIAPIASSAIRNLPLGRIANQLLAGQQDLPGGTIEPDSDSGVIGGTFREVKEEGLEGLPMFADKRVMVGAYMKPTPEGLIGVIRVGVAGAVPEMPKVDLSPEHVSMSLMLPSDPSFPKQWSSLGEVAMDIAA